MNPTDATYDAAVRILSETMRPWRPAELFREAFVSMPGRIQPGHREDERFRERLHKRRRMVVKRGPWFALRRWIDPILPFVSLSDFISISYNGQILINAEKEALRRLDAGMLVRNPKASNVTRTMAAIKGFQVEHHIKNYFKQKWPASYRSASNEKKYHKPAPDDFSLIIADKQYTIDVAQSRTFYPPLWKLHAKKMTGARLRIIAFYAEDSITIQGYAWENDQAPRLRPIERLIARLNMQELPECLTYFEDCIVG